MEGSANTSVSHHLLCTLSVHHVIGPLYQWSWRKREKNTPTYKLCFSQELIHKNQTCMCFGRTVWSFLMLSETKQPSHIETPAFVFLAVSILSKIPPNVSRLGLCNASSRCDSSMKSIWDFQWTLTRVALISEDYVSGAVICQSPSSSIPRLLAGGGGCLSPRNGALALASEGWGFLSQKFQWSTRHVDILSTLACMFP